jgi:hypothetical protein
MCYIRDMVNRKTPTKERVHKPDILVTMVSQKNVM